MTLKGHKAHFNIKFLKGYGHSISVNHSKIVLKSNHDPFSKPESEEWFVKNMPQLLVERMDHDNLSGLSLNL